MRELSISGPWREGILSLGENVVFLEQVNKEKGVRGEVGNVTELVDEVFSHIHRHAPLQLQNKPINKIRLTSIAVC